MSAAMTNNPVQPNGARVKTSEARIYDHLVARALRLREDGVVGTGNLGMTVQELADELGVSRATVGNIVASKKQAFSVVMRVGGKGRPRNVWAASEGYSTETGKLRRIPVKSEKAA